jgi:hypothetical protein
MNSTPDPSLLSPGPVVVIVVGIPVPGGGGGSLVVASLDAGGPALVASPVSCPVEPSSDTETAGPHPKPANAIATTHLRARNIRLH